MELGYIHVLYSGCRILESFERYLNLRMLVRRFMGALLWHLWMKNLEVWEV